MGECYMSLFQRYNGNKQATSSGACISRSPIVQVSQKCLSGEKRRASSTHVMKMELWTSGKELDSTSHLSLCENEKIKKESSPIIFLFR